MHELHSICSDDDQAKSSRLGVAHVKVHESNEHHAHKDTTHRLANIRKVVVLVCRRDQLAWFLAHRALWLDVLEHCKVVRPLEERDWEIHSVSHLPASHVLWPLRYPNKTSVQRRWRIFRVDDLGLVLAHPTQAQIIRPKQHSLAPFLSGFASPSIRFREHHSP